MVGSVFKKLGDALANSPSDGPLIIACDGDREFNSCMEIFMDAFAQYLKKTDPLNLAKNPDPSFVNITRTECQYSIGGRAFDICIDNDTKTISIDCNKPYDRKAVHSSIKALHNKIFDNFVATQDDYVIRTKTDPERNMLSSILAMLCEMHDLPCDYKRSSLPEGILVAGRTYQTLRSREKMTGLGLPQVEPTFDFTRN